MGNALVLLKDCKLLFKELPRILNTALNILLGVTSILESVEEAVLDLKEITDLLQLHQQQCKGSRDEPASEKTRLLLDGLRRKISDTQLIGLQKQQHLDNIQLVLSTLQGLSKRQ